MVYINCVSFFKHMQKLTSSSTHFDIWYKDLLESVISTLRKGLCYTLPLDQVRARFKKLFDINIFESDIDNICSNNNLRAICHCRSTRFYIVPI